MSRGTDFRRDRGRDSVEPDQLWDATLFAADPLQRDRRRGPSAGTHCTGQSGPIQAGVAEYCWRTACLHTCGISNVLEDIHRQDYTQAAARTALNGAAAAALCTAGARYIGTCSAWSCMASAAPRGGAAAPRTAVIYLYI